MHLSPDNTVLNLDDDDELLLRLWMRALRLWTLRALRADPGVTADEKVAVRASFSTGRLGHSTVFST